MPGRQFNNGNYRYGFNGKENDNEVKGTGNQQDYGMRIYDTRLGRFLSVDPIATDYPWLSTYQFAANGPIMNVDMDGLENRYYMELKTKEQNGKTVFSGVEKGEVEEMGFLESIPTGFQDIAVIQYGNTAMEVPFSSVADFTNKFQDLNVTPDNFDKVAETNQANLNAARAFVAADLSNAAMQQPEVSSENDNAPKNYNTGTKVQQSRANSGVSSSGDKSVGPIKGYTKHGLNQAISRNGGKGVKTSAILDAVKNPKKVTESRGGTTIYKGSKANVVLNGDGKVVTTSGSNRGSKTSTEPRKSGGGKAQRKLEKTTGTNYNPNIIR